nr:Histidine acid phosphatase domain containing protein [Haemonchus contortus]
MRLLELAVLWICMVLCSGMTKDRQPVSRDPHTKLVLWGTRHGNRNPEQILKMNPVRWGFEGDTELTSIGKRQALGLGRELRRFVGDLVEGNYLPKQAKYYSSSANRCQMTLQVALAGFYTPTDWADWQKSQFDFWSPVPYTIDDPLLRMYAVKDCPVSDRAWKPISDDTLPDLKLLAANNKGLLNYIAKNTGWPPTISSAADLSDNIIEMDLYNSSYPPWISEPKLRGYNNATFKKAVLAFGEKHQIRCAEYAPCRDIMGGVWLKHTLDSINNAIKGEGPSVIGYASHTEVTLSVMKLLGVEKKELTTSAGFVIEFKMKPEPSIRILDHDPDPIDKHIIYRASYTPDLEKISSRSGWIPFKKFEALVGKFAIDNWQKACGQQTESCKLPKPYLSR